MRYVLLLCSVLAAVAILFAQARAHRGRPKDLEAMRGFVRSRGWIVASIRQKNTYWRYWLRGKIQLSNLARTYVVVADSPEGTHKIHFAFDPWNESGGMEVLQEKVIGKSV